MNNPILSVLVIAIVAVSLGRYYVQRGELRKARQVALAAMFVAAAQLPPHHQPAAPGPDPDERRKPATPPFGSPVACAPDAGEGVDGGGGAMLAEPEQLQQLAGELQAIDVEHTTEGFVVGAPLR